MSNTVPVPGDRVRSDWASGSPDGESHYGVLLSLSPTGTMAKVSWNEAGLPSIVPTSTLRRVADAWRR